jgi:ubiquinone/menaquinone biosynthesis C-methylase UbiE
MTQEQWQVAGNASEVYEKYLVPAVFSPWAHLLIARTNLKQGARVLDVACGTGLVARTAASVIGGEGKVVGLDLNPGMLEMARSTIGQTPVQTEWHEASVVEMPLPDNAFDVVFCQLGLQFFPDRPAALREMNRVLGPGGELAVLVWRAIEHSPGFAVLAAALENHVSLEAAGIMRAPFVFGDNADELRELIQGAGFGSVHTVFDTRMVRFPSPTALFDSYAAGSPLAGHVSGITAESREKLISEMVGQLQSYMDDDGLAFPIQGQIVTARK